MGVEIRTGVTFGEDVTLDGLKKDGYKAVFLATGLHVSRKLNVPGEDLAGRAAAAWSSCEMWPWETL